MRWYFRGKGSCTEKGQDNQLRDLTMLKVLNLLRTVNILFSRIVRAAFIYAVSRLARGGDALNTGMHTS